MRILILLLVLGACAGPQLGNEGSDDLARELASRMAGEPRGCLPTTHGHSLAVVDSRTIASRRGGVIWINRLRDECPGMRPLDTLIVETHGNQYCRGDKMRSLSSGSGIPGPYCILGHFTPYRRSKSR